MSRSTSCLVQNIHSTTRGLAVLALLTIFTEPTQALYYSNTHSFTWILVLSFFAGFAAAYGIGANDVANSFATSVGAKSLTIPQAVSIASICEFAGAVLMGSQVTKTMRSGIADPACFEDNPGLLMWGMFCVLCLTGFWLIFASAYEMPVSTTHSTVGGIIGMTMMVRGSECVLWSESTDEFPYVKGVSAIVISWLLSPICSGIMSALIYGLTYITVLRDKEHSFNRTKYLFPFIVGFTVAVNVGMFIIKGSKGKQDELGTAGIIDNAKDGDGTELITIIFSTFGVTSALTFLVMPLLLKKVETKTIVMDQVWEFVYSKNREPKFETSERVEVLDDETENETKIDICDNVIELNEVNNDLISDLDLEMDDIPTVKSEDTVITVQIRGEEQSAPLDIAFKYIQNALSYVKTEIYTDPYDVINKKQYTMEMHNNCLRHDDSTEEMFKFVQVFSAIIGSLSHGANDIANAMGPFAAIYTIWKLNEVPTANEEIGNNMYWILSYGGAGIIAGLATYGYKIISAMGVKLITVTPSRGYAIELGAAFIVMFGSVQGWPLSTTHCQVGATVGVGLFEGKKGIDPWVLGKAIFGWFATLLVCGMGAALMAGPNPELTTSINN